MLYGQNLPWRHILRLRLRSSGSSSLLLSSQRHTAATAAVEQSQYFTFSSLATSRIHPVTTTTTTSRIPSLIYSKCIYSGPAFPTQRAFAVFSPSRRDDTDGKRREDQEIEPAKIPAEESPSSSSSPPPPLTPNPNETPDPISYELSDNKASSTANGEAPGAEGASGNNGSSNSSNNNNNSGSGSGSGSGGGGGGGRRRKVSANDKALQKPSIPEIYPQVMAIPIAKKPLFPGFYKAITLKNPEVMAAIESAIRMGQPYIGAFLLKDENADIDVIENADDVYDVGTFCQITSAFSRQGDEPSMTAVLYPHRKIKLISLIPPAIPRRTIDAKLANNAAKPLEELIQPIDEEESPTQGTEINVNNGGDVVPSFELVKTSDVTPKEEENEKEKESPPKTIQYEPASFLKKFNVSLVNVNNWVEETYDKKNSTIIALVAELVNVFKDIANMNHLFRDQISEISISQSSGNLAEEPGKLADFAAAVSNGDPHELQETLEATKMEDRLHKALLVLKKELLNAQLQTKISKDVDSKIQKRQREYYLTEQLKGIRRELGIESDGKDKLLQAFKDKASKLSMPEAVQKVFDEELNKLAHIEPAAAEFNVTRNYLDWLTQVPWGKRSVENFDIKHAIKVLDEDHHGLKDVKNRILEFIAVGKLRGTVEGKILFLVGPPGVGKTSIGKSIARALGREYYRFSVGGLSDVAEIKGHRRTYVGALPGRMIQALKKCQTENPLILIDEVDKLGRGYQGDPAAALLELLDPEQNNAFLDHYLDVPVDLSKVLFVCTANMSDTVPGPLLDRMEVLELSGYVADEKMAIAQKYLAPAAKEINGLKDANVVLHDEATKELINKYCRESGVRNLKKQIEKIYRKAAFNIIKDLPEEEVAKLEPIVEAEAEVDSSSTEPKDKPREEKETEKEKENDDSTGPKTTEAPIVGLKVPDNLSIQITKYNLSDYVGPPVFMSDRLYETTPPGVAMGLAWTSMGGAALYIESILENVLSATSKPGMELTGNLKQVMSESSRVAYSFAKGLMARKFPRNAYFAHAKLHMHCPEGAVRKDGPSAGITMASSLISLALDRPLDATLAMTGELTVTGKVLRIGGLREKTVAAKRVGVKTILFPRDNWSDWLELPENIKEGIEGKPVDWYSDVFDTVFPDLDSDRANNLWAKALKKPPSSASKRKKEEDGEVSESDHDD